MVERPAPDVAAGFVVSANYRDWVLRWLDDLATIGPRHRDWKAVVALYEKTPGFVNDAESWAMIRSNRFVEEEAAADDPRLFACDEFEEYRAARLDAWDR